MEPTTITSNEDKVTLLKFILHAKRGDYSEVYIVPRDQIRISEESEEYFGDEDDYSYCYS
jgi:hypothetical protein